MEKLKQRDSVFHIILNDNGANVFQSKRHVYHVLMTQEQFTIVYLGINYHDKDLNEYGDLETPHYHLALQIDKYAWFQTIINWFCELFKCNANQVTISKTDLVMRVRYLIHFDDVDKYSYERSDIVTNNEDFTNKCFKYIPKIVCIDDLISIVKAYPNLLELMSVIGYNNYKKYRSVIRDIRERC